MLTAPELSSVQMPVQAARGLITPRPALPGLSGLSISQACESLTSASEAQEEAWLASSGHLDNTASASTQTPLHRRLSEISFARVIRHRRAVGGVGGLPGSAVERQSRLV